jgi:hypothetical protein
MRAARLAEGNLNFCVAAGRGRVYRCGYACNVQSDTRPFRGTGQNNDGYCSSRKILLVADSPVGRQQYIKRRFLCGIQQCAVVKLVPSSGLSCGDRMARKRAGKALWRSVVKENEHQPERRVAQTLTP